MAKQHAEEDKGEGTDSGEEGGLHRDRARLARLGAHSGCDLAEECEHDEEEWELYKDNDHLIITLN